MAVPIAGLLSGATKIAGATRSRGSGAKLAGNIVKREPRKTEENSAQESKNSSALVVRPKQSLVPYQNIESVPSTEFSFCSTLMLMRQAARRLPTAFLWATEKRSRSSTESSSPDFPIFSV